MGKEGQGYIQEDNKNWDIMMSDVLDCCCWNYLNIVVTRESQSQKQGEKEFHLITKVHSNYNLLCLRNWGMVSA